MYPCEKRGGFTHRGLRLVDLYYDLLGEDTDVSAAVARALTCISNDIESVTHATPLWHHETDYGQAEIRKQFLSHAHLLAYGTRPQLIQLSHSLLLY